MVKKRRILLLIVIIVIGIGIVGAVVYHKQASEPEYHYELSDELEVSFTNADAVIETMREALKNHDSAIHIRYHAQDGHMDDVTNLVRELMKYAMAETDDPKEGDYIRYQYGGYTVDYSHYENGDDYDYVLTITPTYYTDLEQEAYVDEQVKAILKELHFTRRTSDYEKVEAIHDYVTEHVAYDNIHKSNVYHQKATAFAALYTGKASCQGYCVLMYRLLREAGVDCRIITGIGESEEGAEYHSWNLVCVDGLYYNVDATWDARLGSREYFLKSDAAFEKHTRDEEFTDSEFTEQYPMGNRYEIYYEKE